MKSRIRPLAIVWWLSWICAAAVLVVVVVQAVGQANLLDDGLIHLRVVQQLRSGNGPVFNAAERVEGSSSPLWVFLLTVVDFVLPGRLDRLVLFVPSALLIAAVAVAFRHTWRTERVRNRLAIPAGILIVGASPALWDWITSGMEVALILLWLTAAWCLVETDTRRVDVRFMTVAVLGLGPLIRQEFWLVTLALTALLAALSWRDGKRRMGVTALAVAVVPGAAYQVFRMAYFGLMVPNPSLAKSFGSPRWSTGFTWLGTVNREYYL